MSTSHLSNTNVTNLTPLAGLIKLKSSICPARRSPTSRRGPVSNFRRLTRFRVKVFEIRTSVTEKVPVVTPHPTAYRCDFGVTTHDLSTSNTRSYRQHYLAWHSHAVVLADSDTLLLAAFTLSRMLARPATAA